ncbi:MAG: glycoside hydrolase family 97 catalytic domain-containing protein, partial [bacterium]
MRETHGKPSGAFAVCAAVLLMLLSSASQAAEPLAGDKVGQAQAASPDGTIVVSVKAGGALTYAVAVDGRPLLADSRLGLVFDGGLEIGRNSVVTGVEKRAVDRTWHNAFGKCSKVRDHFNETRIRLKEERGAGAAAVVFGLIVRAYDDGVAIRYDLPKQDALAVFTVTHDKTSFTFPKDARALGGKYSASAEVRYPETTLASLPTSRMCLPVVAQCEAATVALAEANVRDWSSTFLKRSSSVTLEAELASKVVSQAPRVSPWHLVMIGRTPGQLIESNLMVNLADPSQIADTSWIRPGIMAWDDWWTGVNPFWKEHRGLYCRGNTASHMMYVDFASEMGWPYQLVDWFWYDHNGKDPDTAIQPRPYIDLPAMFRHAKEKGVGMILWVHSKSIPPIGAEKLFSTYASWGAAGVKIDFFKDNGSQKTMKWQEELLACAAKHRLLVNFHGTAVPTGLSRTWPNLITQEGVAGNEYNKCGRDRECDTKHHVTMPFARCLLVITYFTPG